MSIDDIIGDWMEEAEKSGELKSLKGSGKPYVSDRAFWATPVSHRLAFKMLKDSGFIPPEVKMVGEIKELRARLEETLDVDARAKLLKEITDKEVRVQAFLAEANRG